MDCKCDFKTKMLGDGCEICNPQLALEYAKERIADLEKENAAMKDFLQKTIFLC